MGNKHSSSAAPGGGKRKYKVPANAEPPEAPPQPYAQPTEDDPYSVYIEWLPPPYDGGCPVFGYFLQFKATHASEYTTMGPIAETSAFVRNLDFGVYNFRIIAENLLGYSDASEPSEDLILGGDECGPSFLKELDDTATIVEGGVVSFQVRAIAKPQPRYTWFYNDIELVQSPNMEPRGPRLILRSVPKTMQGQIKCRVANVHGAIETACRLVVGVPPQIAPTSDPHIFARVGEPLRIRFPITGHPTPAIRWTHNGAPASRMDTQAPQLGTQATLKIDNIQREDRGEYELTVQNEFGVDRLSLLVTVADRPAAPRDPPRINLQKDDSCLIEWDEVDDDGGCEVGGYVVEYYRVGWDCWLTATSTRSKAARLRDLIPGSRYMFRVKAENPYGISDPSPQTGVLFIPDRSSGLMGPLEESIDEEEDFSEPTQRTVIEAEPARQTSKPDWAMPVKANAPTQSPRITIGSEEYESDKSRSPKVNGFHSSSPRSSHARLAAPESELVYARKGSTSSPYLTRSDRRDVSPRRPSPSGSPRMNARKSSTTPNVLDHYHDTGLTTPDGVYGLLKRHSLNTGQYATDTIKVGRSGSSSDGGGAGSAHQIYETDSEGEASDFGEVVEVKSSLTLFKSSCSIKTSKERLDSGRTSRASLEMDLETAKELLEEPYMSTYPQMRQNQNRNHEVRSRSERTHETEVNSKTPSPPEQVDEDSWGGELELEVDREPLAMPVGLGRLALNYGALALVIASLFVKYLNLFVSFGMLLVVARALWRLDR